MVYRRLLLSTYLFLTLTLHAHQQPLDVMLHTQESSYKEQISAAVKESFFLESMTFDADIALDADEFFYLVGIRHDTTITPEQLQQAVAHLIQKNKFQSIELQFKQGVRGFQLHWKLVGLWTFKRLKFHGFMLNKERFRPLYLLEPGDTFDEQKHEHSLQRIKQALAKEGFFNDTVRCEYMHDSLLKTVMVNCYIDKGALFTITQTDLIVQHDESLDDQAVEYLTMQIKKNFLSKLQKRSYSKLSLQDVIASMKNFLIKHGFLQSSIELEESINHRSNVVELKVMITLGVKKEFVIVGNNFFTEQQLIDRILLFGSSVWLIPSSIVVDEFLKVYREHGFCQTTVEAHEAQDRVLFIIDEGKRAEIKRISFNGISVPEKKVARMFRRCLKKKYLDQKLIDNAVDNMLSWYENQGFFDVKLVGKKYLVDQHLPHEYTLALTIQEGAPYLVHQITIQDYPELATQGPFAHYNAAQQPQPLQPSALEAQKKWLINYFKQQGFIRIDPRYSIEQKNNQLSVTWTVTKEREQSLFGKTIMMHDSSIPFTTIQRELCYQEGEPYSTHKIRQSMRNLKKLDVFESVQLYPQTLVDQTAPKIMLLKLQEDSPLEIRTRVGFGLQQLSQELKFGGLTYKIGGSLIYKNPLHACDMLRLDVDVLRSERSVEAKYIYPWFLGYPLKAIVEGYSTTYVQPGFMGSRKSLYEVVQQGALVDFTYDRSNYSANISLGCELMETKIVQHKEADMFARSVARAINFEPRLVNKKIPYLFVEPTLIIDNLDNPSNPRRGSFTLATLKGMFPLKHMAEDIFFVKFLVEQSLFIPMSYMVAAVRLRVGHIFHHFFKSVMPNERFYLGGANSIRSYESDLCPPLGLLEECGKTRFVPQGAKTMVNINLELRIPVYTFIDAVFFQDLGILSNNVRADVRAQSLLAGTGGGVRCNTPIGPLRFDIGFKWKANEPEQLSYAWFLTFGQAF